MKNLSPRQIADAIGVSEASIKRWCDKGMIPAQRTAGGHRRVPVNEVVQFLRNSDHQVVEPQLLGLPRVSGDPEQSIETLLPELQTAFVQGEEEKISRILFDLYLSGNSVADIFDRGISKVFSNIGDRWQCGEIEIYEERRGCEACLRVLHHLRDSLPNMEESWPLAFAATTSGDHYDIPLAMLELILREARWKPRVIGRELPMESMAKAIERERPHVFCLSVSHILDETAFYKEFSTLAASARKTATALILGGRALTPDVREKIDFHIFCEDFRNLKIFLKGFYPEEA